MTKTWLVSISRIENRERHVFTYIAQAETAEQAGQLARLSKAHVDEWSVWDVEEIILRDFSIVEVSSEYLEIR